MTDTFEFDERKDFNSTALEYAFWNEKTSEVVISFQDHSARRKYSNFANAQWRTFVNSDLYGGSAGHYYNLQVKNKSYFPSEPFVGNVVRRGHEAPSMGATGHSTGPTVSLGAVVAGVGEKIKEALTDATEPKREYEVHFDVDIPEFETVTAASDAEAVRFVRDKYPNVKLLVTDVEATESKWQ